MAFTIGNLGLTYADEGNSAEAKKLLRQSLEILKNTVGTNHSDYIFFEQSLQDLDLNQHDQHQYQL